MTTCTSCGSESPAGFRFCGSCGSPLEAPVPVREERKVVTVLFADLVGFTSRAEALDPEDVRATLSGFHERARAELQRYGGTVEKFIGDAVMALFGAPVAHEDDPERAVRAAFAVRDGVAELAGGSLDVRIGITTGEALVGLGARPELGEGMAAGDVVNTAARLEAAAPVGSILVDETTFRATDRAIAYRTVEPVPARGKTAPVHVWEALEPRSRLGVDVTRTVVAPLVGRLQEVDLLRDALARTRRERTPQLVTLIGIPGIGKSRLVSELLQTVEREPELIRWRQGRSLPYGQGVSFWALGEMVKAEAGILETDADDEAERKLHETVATLLAGAGDALWIERQLRPLVGLDVATDGGSTDEAFSAWRRFFEALAEDGPTVLVLEDLHWADDGLLDFVDHLVDWATGVPLLVLCTTRPELIARRPDWGGGTANAVTVSLSPLSPDETGRLIASLTGRALMPADLQTELVARAGGNPLYAQEFVRMAGERGARRMEDLPTPESVQGIIAARLDGLEPEAKAVLQDAAVIGKVFWLGAVAAVSGTPRRDVERHLHALERRELVRRERRASVAGEAEYAFWHVLVRDVAYGQIPRAGRAEKHRHAAEWIASLSPERLADRADLLAHHYLAAVEFARASGQETEDLAGPTAAALATAGERALALNAFGAAARHFRHALSFLAEDDLARADVLLALGRALHPAEGAGAAELEEARVLYLERSNVARAAEAEIALAELAWYRGAVSHMLEHVDRAAALVADSAPSGVKASALALVSRYLMLASKYAEAIETGREAHAMAERLGLDEVAAKVLNNIGVSRAQTGDLGGLADLERSIAIAEAIGSIEAIRGYINLASVTQTHGEIERGAELHMRGLESARRYGDVSNQRFLEAELIQDAYLLGDWDDAARRADAFIADVEAGSPHYQEGAVRNVRALIRLGRADGDGALGDARRSLAHADETRDPQTVLPALAIAAMVTTEVGEQREANDALDRLAAEGGGHEYYWAFPGSFAFDRLGRLGELATLLDQSVTPSRWLDAARLYAEARWAAAADALAETRSVPFEAHARLRAAEAALAEGRRADANVQTRSALAMYRKLGATHYVRSGEQLLAASA